MEFHEVRPGSPESDLLVIIGAGLFADRMPFLLSYQWRENTEVTYYHELQFHLNNVIVLPVRI